MEKNARFTKKTRTTNNRIFATPERMATFLPFLLLFLIISSVQGRREPKGSSGRRNETFNKTRPESVAVKEDDEKRLKFLVGGSASDHLGGEEVEDMIGPSYHGNCSGGVCLPVSSSERGDAELPDRMGRSNLTFQNLNFQTIALLLHIARVSAWMEASATVRKVLQAHLHGI